MSSVAALDELRFTRFAEKFTDIYINVGMDQAGFFALNELPREEDRYASRPYVKKEFESRGYKFPLGDDDND